MAQPTESMSKLEVDIFGGTYHVRADKNPDHLRGLADLVDSKMKEVAGRVATVDTTRIAILAALNLADELVQSQNQGQREQEEERDRETKNLVEKMAGMTEELRKVLSSDDAEA
jgi:cell division protein ZapA